MNWIDWTGAAHVPPDVLKAWGEGLTVHVRYVDGVEIVVQPRNWNKGFLWEHSPPPFISANVAAYAVEQAQEYLVEGWDNILTSWYILGGFPHERRAAEELDEYRSLFPNMRLRVLEYPSRRVVTTSEPA